MTLGALITAAAGQVWGKLTGKRTGSGEKQEAPPHIPPAPFFPIWTGGARKLKREPNIAWLGLGAGNLPPLCNQLFLETFPPPFLFIVAQPVRNRQSEEERESEGSHGEIAAQSGQELHAHILEHPLTRAHTHAHSRAHSPPPLVPGPRPAIADSVAGARSQCTARATRQFPRAPTRAWLRDILRVPERGYAIWTCNCQLGIWDFQKMKLATGLCVWVSLLVAAGTVQPSASQSGGSRSLLALQLLNLLQPAWLFRPLRLTWDPLVLRRGGTTSLGPLPWALGRPSFCPQTYPVCVHAFIIVKNHSAPLFFSSLLTLPPFFSRAFSVSLNEIPLVAPVVRDVGDPNPESEGTLPSASGPPEGRILAEVRTARASEGLGSWGGASWVLVGGRAVESGAPDAGFAPVCAASGHCAPSRPSLTGSDPAGAQPGQLERQAGPPWPEGRELGAFSACVPELSPHGLGQRLLACLTS